MQSLTRRTVPVLVMAVLVLSLLLLGLPTVNGLSHAGAAGASGAALQCLDGQVPTADGNGCLLAPPTATPVPAPAAPADGEADAGADPADGSGEAGAADADGEAGNADGEAGDGEADDAAAECQAAQDSEGEADPCEPSGPKWCAEGQTPEDDDCEVEPPRCPKGFAENAEGECYEVLDRNHPCVIAGRVPADVSTNAVLATYTYIPASGECVTQGEFRERVQNFEAAAQEEKEALVALRGVTDEVVALEVELDELEYLNGRIHVTLATGFVSQTTAKSLPL